MARMQAGMPQADTTRDCQQEAVRSLLGKAALRMSGVKTFMP